MAKTTVSALQDAYQAAEAKAHDLQAKADEQRQANAEKVAKANADAAAAQKRLNDAQATAALADRDDGYAVASALGLLDTADELGISLPGAPD